MTDAAKEMFKIGDRVFKANYGRHEKWITCPDCLGSKRVRVVLGDETEVSIECGGCYPGGYDPSLGIIRQYDYSTEVKRYEVTGICMHGTEVEYQLDNFGGSYHTAKDSEVFGTHEEAHAYGELQRVKHEAEENMRWLAKTKDHKSWAWNATYHRRCAKKAEEEADYHRRKAQVCAAKAKEPT